MDYKAVQDTISSYSTSASKDSTVSSDEHCKLMIEIKEDVRYKKEICDKIQ